MPDSRIREFIDEYHKSYLVLYKVKPMITGKEASRVQKMLEWLDEQKIEYIKVYDALLNFFNDQGYVKDQAHPLELFFKGITKYLQPVKKTPEQIGLENIEKAKAIFAVSKQKLDEKLTVVNRSENELMDAMKSIYKNADLEDALRWAKGHRYTYAQSDIMKNKESVMFKRWVEHGKLARKYFGDELINQVWASTTVATPSKTTLSEMIKKAKEIAKE